MCLLSPAIAQVGFASGVTGGAGGKHVTATSRDDLKKFAATEGPLVIRISGKLDIGSIPVSSDKTIEGVGRSPSLDGTLVINKGVSNVIIKNLSIRNPNQRKRSEGSDGITIRGGRRVWVDHCTVSDCGDGAIDMTEGADNITISWCKFDYHSDDLKHRLTMLATGPPKKKSNGRLHVTLHHNWFSKNCGSRMPTAKKAHVHLFNNFFDPGEGNTYATNAREKAEILSENNYYLGVKNPSYTEDGGKIRTRGNVFKNCSGHRSDGRDEVFDPAYEYTLDDAADIPDIVQAGAGSPL